jgi:hypothetical protein
MFEMRFEPISSVAHSEEAALVAQLTCLFTGEFSEGDFDWDDDALLASYVEAMRAEGDDVAADYAVEEPQGGTQLAKDSVLSDVRSLMRTRLASLGEHSPFLWDMRSAKLLELKELDAIDGVGAGYLWLCLFHLSESESSYLQADPNQITAFRQAFDDVFEVISCYAIAGRQEQYTWLAGKQRSTSKFLGVLERVARRARSGKVKTLDQLAPNQRQVNDAGVDGIGLSLHDDQASNDSVLIFAQATIQKTNRRIKVFGSNEVRRIKAFFLSQPLAAAQGALVIPYEGTEIDRSNCADNDCIYITREDVYRLMGNHPGNLPRGGSLRLDAAMASYTRSNAGLARLLSIDGPLSIT